MDFSSSFASSMEVSFARINSLIDSKLSAQENVSQDATNFSFSGESPRSGQTKSRHRATGSLPV